MTSEPSALKPAISLATLLSVFFRVGMASFGGSSAAWLYREIVKNRRWLSEEEFLSALTLSQVLPGANPVNMSIYVGAQLRGGAGGAVAVLGLVGPPFLAILILGALYARIGAYPLVREVMGGLIAVGIGMVLQLGVQLARNIRKLIHAFIAGTIFVAVGILHWPMIPVVLVLAPLSIGIEVFLSRKRSGNG